MKKLPSKNISMRKKNSSSSFLKSLILLWVNPTLKIANIPKFIKIIEGKAFSGCTSLKSVSIPSSIYTNPEYLGISSSVTIHKV